MNQIKILGVTITNASRKEILEYVVDRVKRRGEKIFIITPNPEMLVYASKHLSYQDRLNQASVSLPDGVGLFLASKLQGESLQSRITGVDFIEELCEMSREKPLSMGFLGGKAGVADRAIECLKKKYPWINVVFVAEEWSKDGQVKLFAKKGTREESRNTTIDILFVAFGVPKQEEWIATHLDTLPVTAAIGVGGAFDFLSGDVSRAPKVIRSAGFEWLFRLIIQPWRWKRQLALPQFIYLVCKERLTQ